MLDQISRKLENAGIRVLAEMESYYMFGRDNLIVLVERKEDAFGSIGSPGVWMENGPAFLVWRGQQAFLVAKGDARMAEPEQVSAIRRFSADLESALR